MNRTRNFIKITATAMVLILLLALAPVEALALPPPTPSYTVEIGVVGVTDTPARIQAALEDILLSYRGDTITVTGSLSGVTGQISLSALSLGTPLIWEADYEASYNGNLIRIYNINLTVTGSIKQTGNGGAISSVDGNIIIAGGTVTSSGGDCGIYSVGSGDIIVNDGSVVNVNGQISAIYAAGSNVYITGGVVTASGDMSGILADNEVYITGGNTLVNATAMGDHASGIVSGGDVLISGGTVNASASGVQSVGIRSDNGSVVLNNCEVTAEGEISAIWAEGDVIIDGGTVNALGDIIGIRSIGDIYISGDNTVVNTEATQTGSVGIYSGKSLYISGGTVNASGGLGITAFSKSGYSGSIEISGKKTNVTATGNLFYGIGAQQGSISIEAGAVTAQGGFYGMAAGHGIDIKNAKVTARATGINDKYSIYGISNIYGDVAIDGGEVMSSGAHGALAKVEMSPILVVDLIIDGRTFGDSAINDGYLLLSSFSPTPDMSVSMPNYTYSYSANFDGTGATTKTYPADGAFVNSLDYKWVKIAPASAPNPPGGGFGGDTYTVTFDSQGGSAVPSQSVASGGKAARPATPVKDGYTFLNWFSDAPHNYVYDFDTAVTADITLYAKWTVKIDFEDVHEGDWFYDDVMFVAANGLMTGTSTTKFSPNAPITRSMMVTVLYRAAGSPDASGLANPFSDVAGGAYYADAVKWAAENGIVLGYGDGTYGPNDPITREQMAAIFYRYAVFTGEGPQGLWLIGLPFADKGKISGYALEPVTWCYMRGIVTGKPGNVFDPQGTATRAEAAAMLHRFFAIDS